MKGQWWGREIVALFSQAETWPESRRGLRGKNGVEEADSERHSRAAGYV